MSTDPLAPFSPRIERVTVGGRELELVVLDDDAVLDALTARPESAAAPPPDNPYFGLIWESALVLGGQVLGSGSLAGKTVLDLGCGVGITGISAALAGARVTFADVMPEAVVLARQNAARNRVDGEFVRFDLRAPDGFHGRRFDRVLASDLLYERGQPRAMLAALDLLLAPGGAALLSDPMRPTADAFDREARAAGFRVDVTTESITTARCTLLVRVFELTR